MVTVFAGPPPTADRLSAFASSLHRLWKLDDLLAVETRRAEDRRAVVLLGADVLQLELEDAIYRSDARGAPLYPTTAALFGGDRPDDDALLQSLRAALTPFAPCPFVAAPLGVGGHVDHCLVRDVARATVPADRLWLFEEFPYAESWRARRRASARLGGWETRSEPVTEVDLVAKCRAIECYASQLGTAFRDGRELERRVRRFLKRRGGERLWQPPPAR